MEDIFLAVRGQKKQKWKCSKVLVYSDYCSEV